MISEVRDTGQAPCGWIEGVLDLARDAARRVMTVYDGDFVVERKDDRSPLTEADLASHNAILAGLGILTPDIPVLSEESAAVPYAQRARWGRYWLVDPLDGTREFIQRNGQFTINIALIDDHEPVLGVVHVPVSGVCYYACKGAGAFKQLAPDQPPLPIRVRIPQGSHLIVAGSRSHGGEGLRRFLNNFPDYELISLGSSLKSCLVAEGKADLYPRLGPTSEWDTAAAQCIVEEAGGCVTDTAMRRLLYNTKDSLLNPHFFVSGDVHHDWSKYLP